MNGFTLMADSYHKAADQGEIDKEQAEAKIRIFDFLATCSQDDFYFMVDSSAFNDIIRDFLKTALQNAGADEEMTGKVLNELRWLFSEKTAKEICEK